ncbi:uncharacterized protein B0T23DRAFT_22463 [Neurospora hispaniola]|uniref:Uncharacterized protein n=1 Tax=Neurospora hispaniola TaxID=588809 RepID=A0AAJ0IG52_9PEZI|nr:hypothetical protein B0T23DRAFT_22463 [Neurospora hispaniola]
MYEYIGFLLFVFSNIHPVSLQPWDRSRREAGTVDLGDRAVNAEPAPRRRRRRRIHFPPSNRLLFDRGSCCTCDLRGWETRYLCTPGFEAQSQEQEHRGQGGGLQMRATPRVPGGLCEPSCHQVRSGEDVPKKGGVTNLRFVNHGHQREPASKTQHLADPWSVAHERTAGVQLNYI